MSKLSEEILFQIALKLYQRRLASSGAQDKEYSSETYWRWQYESSQRLFGYYPGLDAAGAADKEIIDIGCGIGGRTCYLAGLGAKRVVGCDINQEEIAIAKRLRDELAPDLKPVLSFSTQRVGSPEFDQGLFDLAVIVDAMEHVESPEEMLEAAYEVLKPGGKLLFGTIGWSHHNASHMKPIIPLPFVQVIFSDKTIINATKRILSHESYQPSQWDSDPPAKRWEGVTSLKDRPGEHINKYSVAMFARALKASPFVQTQLLVHGFSPHRTLLRPLNFLTRAPLLREFWHAYLVGVAQKGS